MIRWLLMFLASVGSFTTVFAYAEEQAPKTPACAVYKDEGKQEFSLSELQCIRFPAELGDLTLGVWDSDFYAVCDFRGSVVSLDGSGEMNISSNYASSTQFTGRKVQFLTSNACPFVKLRVY